MIKLTAIEITKKSDFLDLITKSARILNDRTYEIEEESILKMKNIVKAAIEENKNILEEDELNLSLSFVETLEHTYQSMLTMKLQNITIRYNKSMLAYAEISKEPENLKIAFQTLYCMYQIEEKELIEKYGQDIVENKYLIELKKQLNNK